MYEEGCSSFFERRIKLAQLTCNFMKFTDAVEGHRCTDAHENQPVDLGVVSRWENAGVLRVQTVIGLIGTGAEQYHVN